MNKGFADLCLTTWLRRPKGRKKRRKNEELSSCQFAVFRPCRRISDYNTENQKLKSDSSCFRLRTDRIWSGRRDLNSRPSPWQGDALPLSYSRFSKKFDSNDWPLVVKQPIFSPSFRVRLLLDTKAGGSPLL